MSVVIEPWRRRLALTRSCRLPSLASNLPLASSRSRAPSSTVCHWVDPRNTANREHPSSGGLRLVCNYTRVLLGWLAAHSGDYDVAHLHGRVGRNIEPHGCPFLSRRVATVDAAGGKAPILEVSVFQSRCKQMLQLDCELEDLLAGCYLRNLYNWPTFTAC